MAAFQQRRQQQHQRDHLSEASPPLVDEPSTSSDLAADDSAVLLFGSRTSDNQATSASWSVIRPPRSVRTTSFTSSVGTSAYAATDTSGGGGDDAASSSLGSPLSFTQASLLPAHAGDGVFLTAAASAGSLIMSDDTATEDSSTGDFSERDGRNNAAALFPSIYADLHMVDSSSSDDGRGGIAFSAYSHISRRSGGGGDRQASGGDSFASEASEWALTEAALSTHRALAGDHVTPRLTRTEENEEEEQGSVGLTSGSEHDEDHAAKPRQQQRSTTIQAQAAAAALEKEEQDWAQSAHALSAGFLPASRRPRRAPPPSSSYTRDPQAVPPITVLLPRPGSSSLRSLSPAGSVSARSRRSSSSLGGAAAASGAGGGGGGHGGFKRRHRQAGTGRSSTSQKRNVVAASAPGGADDCVAVGGRVSLSGQALFLEQVAREEENRARRMTAILEQRREEVRLREAEAQVLFGHAIRNYMSIDPVSFALAEAAADPVVPLATIECTPTPSRAHSPLHLGSGGDVDDLHGAEAFIAHAVREGRFAGGVHAPEEEEDSGAETETEHDSDRAAGWTRYSLAAPESRPSRLAQKKNKNKNAPPLPSRSRSTSELANLFESSSSATTTTTITKTMGTFSPITGSGLTARGVHSPTTTLHRRSSSFSGPHHLHHHEDDGRPLSHEERIMLGGERLPAGSTSLQSSAAHHGTAAPWGGDVDSFELALNYWKRMWRRLRGTTTMGGGVTPIAAPTVAHSSSDDGEVQSAEASSAPMRRKQKTVDLLVPEARVGRV